ncbi:MAG: hypothetical protein AAF074_00805 [Pseudomonadota bacterium]
MAETFELHIAARPAAETVAADPARWERLLALPGAVLRGLAMGEAATRAVARDAHTPLDRPRAEAARAIGTQHFGL